jgi:hypothetical protein
MTSWMKLPPRPRNNWKQPPGTTSPTYGVDPINIHVPYQKAWLFPATGKPSSYGFHWEVETRSKASTRCRQIL